MKNDYSIIYGLLAGIGLLAFYFIVVSIFQGIEFAFLNLRSFWWLIFPLVGGFGTQIGLYTSIKHTAALTGTVAGTGGISAGSMVACCSHFLFNALPFIGFAGIAVFLMKYQAWFLGAGIISNLVGISLMLNHKRKMKGMKGGCH
ncbi:MAG: hypothetical protein WD876_01850 [Candidatus Pacearchaeota archaeon]